MGANVYDIVRHDMLVVTTAGLEGLKARLALKNGRECRRTRASSWMAPGRSSRERRSSEETAL